MNEYNKLSNKIVQFLEDTEERLFSIVEMADPFSEIKQTIRDLTPNIVTPLYKLYGFGEEHPQEHEHWIVEISANIRKFCYKRIKPRNKVITTKQIMSVMVDKYMDAGEIAEIESNLYKEYGYSKYNNVELYNKIYSILPKLIDYIKAVPEDKRPEMADLVKLLGTM